MSDRDTKSRQAAAANTKRAREAADKAKKKKETDKAAEKPSRAAARRVKKVPDKEDGDPPDDDPTPWTVYAYRQPQKVKGEYTYEGVVITNKVIAIEPRHTVNTKTTVWGRGTDVKPIDAVTFLQKRPALTIQHLKLEADFRENKPAPLTHCAMHFATRALGFKLKEGKVGDRPEWFTPEVLRAARSSLH